MSASSGDIPAQGSAAAAGAAAELACAEGTSTTSAAAGMAAGACMGAWAANGSENDETVCTGGGAVSTLPPNAPSSFAAACLRSETTSNHALVALTSNSRAEEFRL